METRATRFERKREIAERTYIVVNEEGKPVRCILGPSLTLEDAVTHLVYERYTARRHAYESRDLAIWHMGKLVAVSRHRDGRDIITLLEGGTEPGKGDR